MGWRYSGDGEDGSEFMDQRREDMEGMGDLVGGGIARQAEADGAVSDALVYVHSAEDVRRLEAAAGASGACGGADALFAEEEEYGVGL